MEGGQRQEEIGGKREEEARGVGLEAWQAQAGKLKLRREMRGLGLNVRDVWHEMWGLRWEMTAWGGRC